METKIQELRKANKISQAELADEMGVTRQTIISLEKGRYNASLELAFKIARYFGTVSYTHLDVYKRKVPSS